MVALELLRSARNTGAFTTQSELLAALSSCSVDRAGWVRARRIQQLLAADGMHRGVPPADLLIAVAAESAGVPVLHYDRDYDLIARVSGQPTRWLLPAGSLP